MIDYNPHDWRSHLFDVEGSMIREIFSRVASVTVWSTAVAAFHTYVRPLAFPSLIHTLVGFALSLLLVFRTNASYDRFWEGRRQWGSIVNTVRSLARSSLVLLRDAPDLYERMAIWLTAFPRALTNALRGRGAIADARIGSTWDEVRQAKHVPLAVTRRLTETLNEARTRGILSDIVYCQLDRLVMDLTDQMGACERIRNTPLPFVYVVQIRRALILYTGTLPFVLVQPLGWLTIPCTFAVAYFLYGIEEIGVEIEDPFGEDMNDLPLDSICDSIGATVASLSVEAGLGADAERAAAES